MTSNEVIQEVIDKTDMVELVGEFVALEKSGANYRGLCPFHDESTPSFMVSPQKHLATCFGCHKSLNPIQFISELKNLSFPEALKYVADKAGVKVDISVKKSNEPDLSKYYSMLETSNTFYYQNLTSTENGEEALRYLENRGLNKDVIEKFSIGLSPDKSDIIYQVYKKLGYIELDMQAVGMVNASQNGNYHDVFTRRIMFPIYDDHNNLVGFSGRVYKNADKDQPKYINSPDSIVYKKRNVLFNINNAINDARKRKRIILCEGQMDVIACDRAGFGEAVCSLGSMLTEEQCQLIKKYAKDVIVMYDNDHAGIDASIRAIPLLRKAGLGVSLVHLKGVKDADEMVLSKGVDALKDFINDNIVTVNEYLFEVSTEGKNFTKESDFIKSKNFIFGFLKDELSDSVVEMYLTKLSELTNVSYESIVNDFNSFAGRRIRYKYKSGSKPTRITEVNYFDDEKHDDKYIRCTRRLFGYATLSKKNAMYIDSKIDISGFDDIRRSVWMELVDNYYHYTEEYDPQRFAILISSNQVAYEAFRDDVNILSKDVVDEYNDEDMLLCIDVFNESVKLNMIADLRKKLAAETSPQGKIYYLNKIAELSKHIKK